MRLIQTGFLLVLSLALLLTVGPGIAAGDPTADHGLSAAAEPTRAAGDTSAAPPDVIVYYFHRTARCYGCLTIEANVDETLKRYFADLLESGRLRWLPVNVEDKGEEHFVEDFNLDCNSVILVRLEGGKTGSWINLEKVWDLIEDKPGFLEYVRTQVSGVLRPDGEPKASGRGTGGERPAPAGTSPSSP